MRLIQKYTALFALLLWGVCIPPVYPGKTDAHLYSTGSSLEVDRCASAWLIKRYVDKQAEFMFFPEESLISQGIVFDRPEGNLHRSHNKATFEVIMAEYGISVPAVQVIAGIIHDIEVNFWGKKTNMNAGKVTADLQRLIRTSKDNEAYFAVCFPYFDRLQDAVRVGNNAQ